MGVFEMEHNLHRGWGVRGGKLSLTGTAVGLGCVCR